MEDGENGVPSKAVFARMESAKEHEPENVTILLNPMEVRCVSEEISHQNLALPICVVIVYFSFRSYCHIYMGT